MFLLAILVGHNEQAGALFRAIKQANNMQSLGDLLPKTEKKTPKAQPAYALLAKPIRAVLDDAFLRKPLLQFHSNLELVSRFSFRTIVL
jgi:hypothetical protein